MNYIVYAIHEPNLVCEIHGNQCPLYIGKGKPNRPYQHFCQCYRKKRSPFYIRLDSLIHQGIQPQVRIIAADLTEQEAFDIEIKLIALYGRQDNNTGCLFNQTNGGEGQSGAVGLPGGWGPVEHSLDTLLKMSRRRSESARLNHKTAMQKAQGRPVESVSLKTGNVIRQYPSIGNTKRDGFSPSGVHRAVTGQTPYYKLLHWRYCELSSIDSKSLRS